MIPCERCYSEKKPIVKNIGQPQKGVLAAHALEAVIKAPQLRDAGCAIEAGPCSVLQVKTGETDGYQAIQLGYGDKKEKRVNRRSFN